MLYAVNERGVVFTMTMILTTVDFVWVVIVKTLTCIMQSDIMYSYQSDNFKDSYTFYSLKYLSKLCVANFTLVN